MRVVVRKAFKAYINMQPENFSPGQKIKGDTAAHLLRTGAAVDPDDDDARTLARQIRGNADDRDDQEQEPPPPPPATAPGDGTPGTPPQTPPGDSELDIDASVADVLDWVDGDPERAAVALGQERAKDKPRSTLTAQLTKIVDA